MENLFQIDLSMLYSHLILIFGVYALFLSLSNIIYLNTATKKPTITDGPMVSILIPARNEENNIYPCLESLINQTYRNYEIIILDDQSNDSTYEIISEISQRVPNIRTIKGKPLPKDWNGKPFAMHQLAAEAEGEYLIFTDADTRHTPTSISWAVTNAEKHGLDLLSGYPMHINKTLGEKIVVPNMYLNTILFLPLWGIPLIPLPIFSMAIGQFLMFRTSSYKESGGYTLVKKEITEDVYISREMKRRGYKTGMLDAKKQLSCRMYNNFRDSADGIGKNIFDYFEKKLTPIFTLAVFIVLFLSAPPLWAAWLSLTHNPLYNIVLPGILMFFSAWGFFLRNRRQDLLLPLAYPVMFFILIFIAAKSVLDYKTGRGYVWKGRNLIKKKI